MDSIVSTGDTLLDDKIGQWLRWDQNEANRSEIVGKLESKDLDGLSKIFRSRLEFGTAGLRGVMAAGPSRMNDLTIIQTSQGMAKYMVECFPDVTSTGIVIGYDGRHNSRRFAALAARAFVSLGMPVKLFSDLVPTPYIPFSVCHLQTKAGIMVTASHNPKDDNGYKVYWDNGAQIITPHDKNIQKSILDNLTPWENAWQECSVASDPLVSDPLDEINEHYFKVLSQACVKSTLNSETPLKFTYTPVHGVGAQYIRKVFNMCRFKPFIAVDEQIDPDPEFSTVKFPNPEEGKATLNLALATATRNHSTIVLANDPDADRLACAELQPNGEWKVFTGNELGALLGWWMYRQAVKCRLDIGKSVMLSSTVSSKILETMAKHEGFLYEETLTGFKWMGNRGLQLQQQGHNILFAFEEAIGFMCGIHVPDKDGVSAAAHLAELAVYLDGDCNGCTLTRQLQSIYETYGYHLSCNSYFLCYDPETILRVFQRLRTFHNEANTYPTSLKNGAYPIRGVRDLTTGYDSREADNKAKLPASKSSQMITFYFENGLDATIRTSGTEPKIKYYTELRSAPGDNFEQADELLKSMVRALVEEFLQPSVHGLIDRPE